VDPLEAIRLAEGDGLALAWPLSVAEIARLQEEVGASLPRKLVAVLGQTGGIGGTKLDGIDFTGRDMEYSHRELFPLGLPIAADGTGSFWVVDLTAQETQAAVFFACHDPPIVLCQSPDLGHFHRYLPPPRRPGLVRRLFGRAVPLFDKF
jgi:SMI1 / KNR4 family (SUKH-1)